MEKIPEIQPEVKQVKGGILKSFLLGLAVATPLLILGNTAALVFAFVWPWLFGLAFYLSNRDLEGAGELLITLGIWVFPISFFISAGWGYFLGVFMYVGLLSVVWFPVLALIFGLLVGFPGFSYTWLFLGRAFPPLHWKQVTFALAGFTAIMVIAVAIALLVQQSDPKGYKWPGFLALGWCLGGINAWYRNLFIKFGWVGSWELKSPKMPKEAKITHSEKDA